MQTTVGDRYGIVNSLGLPIDNVDGTGRLLLSIRSIEAAARRAAVLARRCSGYGRTPSGSLYGVNAPSVQVP